MENEWKILKKDNLPQDILVEGRYEFADKDTPTGMFLKSAMAVDDIIHNMCVSKRLAYYYRQVQPEPPSHEEIMTKWWETDSGGWVRIIAYKGGSYCIIGSNGILTQLAKNWFTGRKSAVVPPEAD